MATSNRVRKEGFSDECEFLGTKRYTLVVDKVKGKWRIYEAVEEYSSTTGGFVSKGKTIRRYDPEAGDKEGKFAQFTSKQEAIEYAEKWLISK